MNETIVVEYVELCARLASLDSEAEIEAEERLYARLDQLWYAEMTGTDRAEAERRLAKLETEMFDAVLASFRAHYKKKGYPSYLLSTARKITT